jgi:hypothetical protein
MEALHAFETMRAFMYACKFTKRDYMNINDDERLLFSLNGKSAATKQMRINDFLKKK